MTVRNILLIIPILFGTTASFGQHGGSIQGKIVHHGGALEFATVFLTLSSDTSKLAASAMTDSLGEFSLDNLAASHYQLHVTMLGFTPINMPVSITPENMHVDLHAISMTADPQVLKMIEVTGMRNMYEKTEEGIIVKASENITQIGGTAADLLKNMPGVLVNADGELTIRGKTPLTLINGRVSGITGIDRGAQLERIPAGSIERIEIINNPSAKYDADAEGGVINIVLKKNQDPGTNGAFAIGAGIGDRYRLNASTLLNRKSGKWNTGVAYDNWYTTRTRRVRGDRTNLELPDEYFLTQRRFDERLIFFQNAKATVDYTPNKKNTVNFEALWAFPGENNNETLNNQYQNVEHDFTSRNSRHSNEIRRTHALETALRYNRRFTNPDKSFTATLSNTFSNDKENTDISTQRLTKEFEDIGDASWQRTHTYQKTNLTSIAADYAQPVSPMAMVEAGYKSIFRFLHADYERANQVSNEFVIDPFNTNIFDFREQIHAVYLQYTGWTASKEEPVWKYSAGLRAEQVWNNGETSNESTTFSNQYFNFFPSVNLFYYTKSRNNFKLSYSRRINRPGLGQLNPFTDITDSLNQRAGNPHLKPELIHSLEAGYNYMLNKTSFSLTTFYRTRSRAIFAYTILDGNGVAFTQPLNFGRATTYGMEAIAAFNPKSFWNCNASFSAYEILFGDDELKNLSTRRWNWYGKLINNLSLAKNNKLQIIANYTSPAGIPQGKSVAIYFVDVGIQQKIMHGKGRLGLTATDIFNTQRSGLITSDYNFVFKRTSKLDTRALMLTFGYTFSGSFKEKLMENKFQND